MRPARRIPWTGLAVAAVMCVPCTLDWMACRSAFYARELMPRSAAEASDPASIRAAAQAVRLLPWNDVFANLASQVCLAHAMALPPAESPAAWSAFDGWLGDAERSARRAIALTPQRATNYQTLGNIYLLRAQREDRAAIAPAAEAYGACLERAPVNALAMLEFAYRTLALGRPDLALKPAARAASLYPGEAVAQTIYGEASLALGDSAAATAAFTRALAGNWRQVPYSREAIEQQRDALSGHR
jgi:tetratricopeptide (TPR) repeat protein